MSDGDQQVHPPGIHPDELHARLMGESLDRPGLWAPCDGRATESARVGSNLAAEVSDGSADYIRLPESEVATGEGFDIIDDIIEKLWDLPPPPPPPPVRTQAAGTGDLDDVVHALSAWSQTANTLKSVSSARHVPVDAKPCPPKPTAAVPVGSAEYLRLPKSEVAFKFATGPDNPYLAPEMEVGFPAPRGSVAQST